MMEFVASAGFDPRGLSEHLREGHGYLGPVLERSRKVDAAPESAGPEHKTKTETWAEEMFYPTVELSDGTLHIEARTASGSPIDERSRDAIQAIIDAYTYIEPEPPKTVEDMIAEATSFADLKQRVADERARRDNRRP